MARYTHQQVNAAANLLGMLHRGQTLYFVTRKIATSGASRIVAVFHVDAGTVHSLNLLVGPYLDLPILATPHGEGVKIRNGQTGADLIARVSLALFGTEDALNAVEL